MIENRFREGTTMNLLSTFRWNVFPGVLENSTVRESSIALFAVSRMSLQAEKLCHAPMSFLLWRSRLIFRVTVLMKFPQYGKLRSPTSCAIFLPLMVASKFVRVLSAFTPTPYSGRPSCMTCKNFFAWTRFVVMRRKSSISRSNKLSPDCKKVRWCASRSA